MEWIPMKREKNSFGWEIIILIIFLTAAWQLGSLCYSPVILPSPHAVLRETVIIMGSQTFYHALSVTLLRLVTGVVAGVLTGCVFGILMGVYKPVKRFCEPAIYFIQATPPILYMTLALIWFGLNGEAVVFIVFIASAPIMAINVREGFDNIDIKLIEMGKLFKFSQMKMLRQIVIPSLKPYFKSGFIVVMGLSWKLAVMGEYLGANTGLGAHLTDARVNLQTDKVFAWGLLIIILCFLSQKIITVLMEVKYVRRKEYCGKNKIAA